MIFNTRKKMLTFGSILVGISVLWYVNKVYFKKPKRKPIMDEENEEDDFEQSEQFTETVDMVNKSNIMESLSDEDKLQIYAHYKQVVIGNCNTKSPSMLDFVAKAKWDAWNDLKNIPRSEAQTQYIHIITRNMTLNADDVKPKAKKQQWKSVSIMKASKEEELLIDDTEEEPQIISIVKNNDTQTLQTLLETGVFIDELDSEKRTGLHWACDEGYLDIVKILIENKSNVNQRDIDGLTPLHYSAICGYPEISNYLLSVGADPNIEDNEGEIPEL